MASTLQQRTARGAVLASGLVVFQRLVTIPASIVLARVLDPADFGIYAIVAFIATFFSTFSNIGFGAALIQQRDPPTRLDLTTTFTAQLTLVTAFVLLGFALSEPISQFYNMREDGLWLIRVLLLSLPITLLRTIPALLLERELLYGRLGIIEAAETLAFYGTAAVMALLQFGVWSFIWATIVRVLLGAGLALVLSPWRPGLGFSREVAIRLVNFGLPYQLREIFSLLKDSITPTLLGLLAGATAVGYINWAVGLAMVPAMLSSSLWRVTFPAFSRAQEDPDLLKRMVERSLRLVAIAFLPLSFLLMGAAPQIITYVYTEKWMPALFSFYLFSLSILPGVLIATIAFTLFNAAGNSKLPLYFTILYGVLDWSISVPLVLWLGFNGIAVRALVVAYITLPLLLRKLNQVVAIDIPNQLVRPFLTAAAASLLEYLLLNLLPPGLVSLVLAGACAALMYIAIIAVWERDVLRTTLLRVLPVRMHGMLRWYLAGP